MKKNNSNENVRYIAPNVSLTEITVEKGFAESGGEDYESARMIISDYGDGVTL